MIPGAAVSFYLCMMGLAVCHALLFVVDPYQTAHVWPRGYVALVSAIWWPLAGFWMLFHASLRRGQGQMVRS